LLEKSGIQPFRVQRAHPTVDMSHSNDPRGRISHLAKADGSGTVSHGGYTIEVSVNGPIEAPRRDENPFEALIDIIVRPAAGVGGQYLPILLLAKLSLLSAHVQALFL
jgi:hypothetical protein